MEKVFDIRLARDREALSDLLPEIDNRTFTISRKDFIDALTDIAFFLKNPDWMIYQWGAFQPISIGKKNQFVLGLVDALELGIAFRRLSVCTNFNHVIKGFFNPTQFYDARFEIRVALFFLSLPSTKEIVFSPEYEVRGHIKRPDFDVIMKDRTVTVECKRPNQFLSKALNKTQQIANHLKKAMDSACWPHHLRLEINIIGPIREQLSSFANKVIKKALKVNENKKENFLDSTVQGVVVKIDSPFRITDVTFSHDIMIIGEKPTGLLNPEATLLRVTSSRIGNQLSIHAGKCVNKALMQLPLTNDCLIFIGEVPFTIAINACERRLSEPAYSHILSIGVLYGDKLKFIHRKTDREMIKELNLI